VLRAMVLEALDVAGYEVNAKWRVPALPLARKLRQIFASFQIDQVIDVGANLGQYYDFLRLEVGFKSRVFSFEPDPDLAATLLRRSTADPLWTIFPVGLAAEPGRLPFNTMSERTFNSFRKPASGLSRAHAKMNTIVRTHEVEVTTLDHLEQQFGGLERTYLKIDTQGLDLEVLKGGRSVIDKIPAVQAEVSFRALYEGSPSYVEAINAFTAQGFAVSDLFLVASDDYMRALEFDCVMVRSESI
jgi:FkbM family methyltransferase